MFHKVPVVLNSFNVELRQGIDYISTDQTNREINVLGESAVPRGESQTWAPMLSNISVQITPIYSSKSVSEFSMKKFVRGELNGKEGGVGFI